LLRLAWCDRLYFLPGSPRQYIVRISVSLHGKMETPSGWIYDSNLGHRFGQLEPAGPITTLESRAAGC